MTVQPFPKNGCFGCEACAAVCPHGAIRMAMDGEGFLYPQVDQDKCVSCGKCQAVCPMGETRQQEVKAAYALRANDPGLLAKSTSGGAFTLLAQRVLDMGGLVAGATYGEGMEVTHVLGTDLGPMRKSKYIQSSTRKALRAMLPHLRESRPVLFSGTPCQVDGARRFVEETLGEETVQRCLYTVALICRGVLSPGLWSEYVHYLSQKGRLESFDFRDKSRDNEGHTVSMSLSGQQYSIPMFQDPFSRIYLSGMAMRPSCHQCPYTRTDTPFDVTIGDLFSAERFFEDWKDGKGASTLIVRSPKGMQLLRDIEKDAELRPLPPEALSVPSLTAPIRLHMMRRFLMGDLKRRNGQGHCDMALMLKKYGGAQISSAPKT